jgi:hypothetical protein
MIEGMEKGFMCSNVNRMQSEMGSHTDNNCCCCGSHRRLHPLSIDDDVICDTPHYHECDMICVTRITLHASHLIRHHLVQEKHRDMQNSSI